MKHAYTKYFFLFTVLLSGMGMFAQVDNPMGGLSIPKSNTTTTVSPTLPAKADVILPITPPKKNYSSADFKEDSNFSMVKKDEFINRGTEFQDKVNASVQRKGESNEAYRGNQSFGEIRTKSKYLNVLSADYGLEDGDRIRVLVNDRVVIPEFTLTNNTKALQIMLQPGFNKIDFEAMNQGTSGPNTAQFSIYDDKEDQLLSNQWNLATGFKASVMVIKE